LVEYGLATAVLAGVAVGVSRFGRMALDVLCAGVDRAATLAGLSF